MGKREVFVVDLYLFKFFICQMNILVYHLRRYFTFSHIIYIFLRIKISQYPVKSPVEEYNPFFNSGP